MANDPLEARLKEARDFAWNHFDLHAKQRMEMFRSYVTFIAVVYAGYGVSLQARAIFLGIVLCLFAIIISVIFYLFDLRIRQLLKISERYLLDEELRLSKAISNRNIRVFHKSDLVTQFRGRCMKLTYSELFRSFYLFNSLIPILFIIALIILSHQR